MTNATATVTNNPVNVMANGGALAKLQKIEKELGTSVFERQDQIRSIMIGAITGMHVLLLGVPGTAKSMLITNFIQHIDNASLFKYLLSKTTSPDEVVGPISLKELAENEKIIHKTAGFLPESEFAFLDEIFKANSPLQNSLLSILNERIFTNGSTEQKVPLKMMLAASNEIPLGDDETKAFVDRLVQQFWVKPIQESGNVVKMLERQASNYKYQAQTKIDITEIEQLTDDVKKVQVPTNIIQMLVKVLSALEMGVEVNPDIDSSIVITVSERRKNSLIRILQAQALLEGRTTVQESDFGMLYPSLIRARNEKEYAEHREAIDIALLEMSSPFERELKKIMQEATNLRNKIAQAEDESAQSNAALDARNSLKNMLKRAKDVYKQAKAEGNDLTEQVKEARDHIDNLNQEIYSKFLAMDDIFGDDDDSELPF